jgi:hypothetical protein
MKKILTVFVYIFALIGFVLVAVYLAVQLGWTKTEGLVDTQRDYFQNQTTKELWVESEEWLVLKEAIKKDAPLIQRVALETGIPARMIVTPLVVEQLRLFNSEREIFKQIFAPLKILGNQSQFSWGVMGIKQDTAKEIEKNLKDKTSPFYLGADFENILDFKTENPDNERFERMTDEDDRYYSYLYGALIIAQIEKQWEQTGFPITNNAGVVSTLYNIGFVNSKPKADPQIGGAEIDIDGKSYSFGGLAQSFYHSEELIEEFPFFSEPN